MNIKRIIKKWLGIDILETNFNNLDSDFQNSQERLSEIESEVFLFEGASYKEGGTKELVWHICRFLGVRPRREYYQEVKSQEMVTKRRFWLEKGKKNTKLE